MDCHPSTNVARAYYDDKPETLKAEDVEPTAFRTWEIMGPVSTPIKLARNSCENGSTEPSMPFATPNPPRNPGMSARLTVANTRGRIRARWGW